MHLSWLFFAIRALEPQFDQAGWLGKGKRPFVRLGRHLQQLGYIDFALDSQKRVYVFSCKPKLGLLRSQLCDHPNFHAAVESFTAKMKRDKVARIQLRPDFDLRRAAMNQEALEKEVDKLLDARQGGPSQVEVNQRVVAEELHETPVQLMFSF